MILRPNAELLNEKPRPFWGGVKAAGVSYGVIGVVVPRSGGMLS